MVPVRFIAENFGAEVLWDDATRTVTLTLKDKTVKIVLDKAEIDINGEITTIDVPAQSIEGRTMLPLRAFVENVMGKKIFWDARGLIVITDTDMLNSLISDVNDELVYKLYSSDDIDGFALRSAGKTYFVMADGEIQQIGTPEEIYNEPANLFVADFIGESNIFHGRMTGPKKAFFCGAEFSCVDPYKKGTVIDAVVRPEDIKITEVEKGQITGEVLSADFKGTFYNVVVRSGKTEIEANSLKYYEPGTIVGMKIAPDNIHLIPYDNSINHYDGVIVNYYPGKGLLVEAADFSWYVEPERIFPEVKKQKNASKKKRSFLLRGSFKGPFARMKRIQTGAKRSRCGHDPQKNAPPKGSV